MPGIEEVKSSWADEVESEEITSPSSTSTVLPPSTEVYENGFKIVTEWTFNKEGKKVKNIRTYKVEKRLVSKTIAKRKIWKKFGESLNDKPGPNPATTVVSEDVFMQFITSKEEDNKMIEDESSLDKLKGIADKGVVKCRTCNGDHWTTKCPYKDTVLAGGKVPDDKKSHAAGAATQDATAAKSTATVSKYIPPSLREGAASKRDGSSMQQRREDTTAIRISNLSDSTTEADLEELVKPFGHAQKLYLAKDKATNECKGFAYVHFKTKADAECAIRALNGHGYDHLILSVDWSKPPSYPN